MRLRSLAYSLVVVVLVVVILAYTRDYLLPFLLAAMFWYLIRAVRTRVSKVDWIERSIPHGIQNLIAATLLFLIAGLVVFGLIVNVRSFLSSLDMYDHNLELLNKQLHQWSGWDLLKELKKYTGSLSVSSIVRPITKTSIFLASNGLMVVLYTAFMLSEERRFGDKIKKMFPDKEKHEGFMQIVRKIDDVCGRYLLLKTIISLLTALVNYLILAAMGVKFAFLWAFLIFVLNYIPNIGPIVATIFPVLATLLQFGAIEYGLLAFFLVGSVQMLSGNVIEPMILSDSMNVSTLVILVTLVFWGALWGFVGMFLSVPLTVMCLIIFSQLAPTRSLAILLSGTGELDFAEDSTTKDAPVTDKEKAPTKDQETSQKDSDGKVEQGGDSAEKPKKAPKDKPEDSSKASQEEAPKKDKDKPKQSSKKKRKKKRKK